jgi:ABC-type uncharacterized transport system ATPase subunit
MIRRKRTSEKTERHHVILYAGDLDRLRMYYPDHSPSTIVRELVRALIEKNERHIASVKPINLEIPDDELQRILASLPTETPEPG